MKPPKSIKNIVHSILGKKSKSSFKETEAFQDGASTQNTNLDKNRKQYRSADDLLRDDAASDFQSSHISSGSFHSRSRSLPRRSQSCLSVRPSINRQPDKSVNNRRIVSGNEQLLGEQKHYPRNSSRTANISRRPLSQIEDYGDLPRTTSWSHSQFHTDRFAPSSEFSSHSQQQHSRRPISQHTSEVVGNFRGSNRFSFHETPLHGDMQSRRQGNAKAQRQETDEKLRTCLHVLDRLSVQMKEIKDVSKRVRYVDTKVKTGNMERGERERRLRELDLAEAASQRLKNLIKTGVEEVPSTRLSSASSGYDSENSNGSTGRNSSLPRQVENLRKSRPPSRISQPHSSQDRMYQGTHPYPQSVSDMMSIWDAKELAARTHYNQGRRMTREDSTSSGYATGSGSEDDRQDSPNTTDADSVASMYSMQGGRPQIDYRHEATKAWNQQHFNHIPHQHGYSGYEHDNYDPYTIYGSYRHQRIPSEQIYGSMADVYSYAPSSVYEHEIYSNGWYRLPSSNHTAVDQYNQAVVSNPAWSQVHYSCQPVQQSTKYGGLSDLFYDPTAQNNATLMENIAKEVAIESKGDESTWKSYGSFRYRNGQRTITAPTIRKRKTVRFSPTVQQRVETEESEMEDSTSVIKGGADEDKNEDTAEKESNPDDGIYMKPRQHPVSQTENPSQDNNTSNHQLPEPIYEFPSGHIESSCMCNDCILARGSCQMQPTKAVSYF